MNPPINKKEYSELLKSIKQRIHAAQYEALKAANKEHIRLYWDIGKMMFETNFDQTLPEKITNQAKLAVKDE